MQTEIISIKCNVALTRAEWDHLVVQEKLWDETHSGYWPNTWKFPHSDGFCNCEWEGMFGRRLWFEAEPGKDVYVYDFIRKLVKTRAAYITGLEQGESGGDLKIPARASELDRRLMTEGWRAGRQWGKVRTLTEHALVH